SFVILVLGGCHIESGAGVGSRGPGAACTLPALTLTPAKLTLEAGSQAPEPGDVCTSPAPDSWRRAPVFTSCHRHRRTRHRRHCRLFCRRHSVRLRRPRGAAARRRAATTTCT